jgi:dolichol-phosphate mannosyltransferase
VHGTPVSGNGRALGAEVVVVVPTYNERDNLPVLIERIFAAAEGQRWRLEVLVVDDQSPDGTAELARTVGENYPGRVTVLERSGPRGLAVSVLDGIGASEAPVIVVMDADLSHPPESLPRLVAPILSGQSDFVIGSRYVEGGSTPGWGFARRLNSFVATLLARPLCGGIRDPLAGFFALRRAAIPERSSLTLRGYKIGLELLAKADSLRVAEVPIEFRDRSRGQSKLGLRAEVDYLLHLVRLYGFRFFSKQRLKRRRQTALGNRG